MLPYARGLDYSTPWRQRYDESRIALSRSLNITFPILQQVSLTWELHKDTLIVDPAKLK